LYSDTQNCKYKITEEKKKVGSFQLDDVLAQSEWKQMCFENWYSCLYTAISVKRECPEWSHGQDYTKVAMCEL